MNLPATFAAGALYDTLLQGALRQFFDRATFETTPTASVSSDGRLAIEPTGDPSILCVRWFGSRHTLTVPRPRPFTPHETRFARAIGSVLAARYRAIFNPKLMAERGDLFRGAIEDRYVGAFLDAEPYAIEATEGRADALATAIEVLRVAALSSYENRSISSGVLLVDADDDPTGRRAGAAARGPAYGQALTAIKSFYRLCDGVRTVFLVNRGGAVLDIVEVDRWAAARGVAAPTAPCARTYRAHARATSGTTDVCIVLSPTHEIKVFAGGAQVFTFRNAAWHLLDVQAKYEVWQQAVGSPALAERLFLTALDLADAREGALFVVARDPAAASAALLAPADRLDETSGDLPAARQEMLSLLRTRSIMDIDPAVLEALASIDGATMVDGTGRLLAAGAILRHPTMPGGQAVEGARTTAAMAACRFGPVLKVSEDGVVTFYDREKIWDI
jgi:hypothetical protein